MIEYRKLRIRKDTAERLKVLAAIQRQSMIAFLDVLIADAEQRQPTSQPRLELTTASPPVYRGE